MIPCPGWRGRMRSCISHPPELTHLHLHSCPSHQIPHGTATTGWFWGSKGKETSHLPLARNILHQSLSMHIPAFAGIHPLKGAVPMGDGGDRGLVLEPA